MVYLGIPDMSEHPIEQGLAGVVETYELLDRVRTRQDLVIRDDQFEFPALSEAARYAARRRFRMSLVDTGRFGLGEVEALARAGVRILTSDDARPRTEEWEILQAACRVGGTRLSVFWTGPLLAAGGPDEAASPSLEDLLKDGMDLHVSNRIQPRDPAALSALAAAARKGRAFLVVYHIGAPEAGLTAVAAERAWIHIADEGIAEGPNGALAVEIAQAAAGAGTKLAVHVERGLDVELLERLWEAGAALLFRTPPSDDRSLLRPIERRAARRKLPARAYRLTTAFLP
jgi:hypothetical protein